MLPALIAGPIGFVAGNCYPAFKSFKAVRNKDAHQYHRWMKYWIVFSGFQAITMVTDTVFSWFPFYQEVKLSLVFWMAAYEGSNTIYLQFVAPLLDNYEPNIDDALDQITEDIKRRANKIGTDGYNSIQNAVLDTIDKASKGEINVAPADEPPSLEDSENWHEIHSDDSATKITETIQSDRTQSSSTYFSWLGRSVTTNQTMIHQNSQEYAQNRPRRATGPTGMFEGGAIGKTAEGTWWSKTASTATGLFSLTSTLTNVVPSIKQTSALTPTPTTMSTSTSISKRKQTNAGKPVGEISTGSWFGWTTEGYRAGWGGTQNVHEDVEKID
eukprot:CFRG2031T1